MLFRKILEKLLNWKVQKVRKPLLLRGARQVGKSTIVKEFAKNFQGYIELNLEKTEHAKFFIEYADHLPTIISALDLEFKTNLSLGETLLFIDEIQEQPQVISLLRYFYEDFPQIPVIAAGSLLEFVMGEVPSFPVGRIEQLPIYPLDFEEFLMALGENQALALLKTIPIPDFAHDKLLQLFQKYMQIGGMPEVVAEFASNSNQIYNLNTIYSAIWDNYRDDIEKYGKNNIEKRVLNHILQTAPSVRDRITFNGFGASQYGSREVSEAFSKLHKAGIIKLIYPSNNTDAPLAANFKRKPKIQFLDTGLLNYAGNLQQELLGVKDWNSLYKGYILNHVLFQELIASSERIHDVPFFWTRESTNSNAEVDILINHQGYIMPIEIKSGAKGSLKSLHEFMELSNHTYAFRLLSNKFLIEKSKTKSGKEFTLINLPYYCIGNIDKWVSHVLGNY